MNFVVISMYTMNSIYEEVVEHLEESMRKYTIPYKLYIIKDQKSWEKNCQQKAIVIKDALAKFQKPIVWVDADAVFSKFPVLFTKLKTLKMNLFKLH